MSFETGEGFMVREVPDWLVFEGTVGVKRGGLQEVDQEMPE